MFMEAILIRTLPDILLIEYILYIKEKKNPNTKTGFKKKKFKQLQYVIALYNYNYRDRPG